MAIRRVVDTAGRRGLPWGWQEDEVLSEYPSLCAYLADIEYDDGSPRKPCSLAIFTEDGILKACLSDRDAGRVAFVAGVDLSGVLAALEKGLAADQLDWRVSRQAAGGGRSKK